MLKAKRYVSVKYTSTLDRDNEPGKYGFNNPSQKLYTYEDKLKTPLQEFDVVLVPTIHGMALAIVQKVNVPAPNISTKQVAEKLESSVLGEQLKAERAAAIEKKLKKAVDDMNKLTVYEAYAKDNPEIAGLLTELKELQ